MCFEKVLDVLADWLKWCIGHNKRERRTFLVKRAGSGTGLSVSCERLGKHCSFFPKFCAATCQPQSHRHNISNANMDLNTFCHTVDLGDGFRKGLIEYVC